MHRLFIFVTALLGYSVLSAQPTIQWQLTHGGSYFDEAKCILQTKDKGFLAAGNTASADGDITQNKGGNDIWLVKIDENGVVQWEKTFGGTNNDWLTAIQQTIDHGYILCGTTQSEDGDITRFQGLTDGWIIKLDESGNLEWQNTFGGSNLDNLWSVRQTADNGYITAGSSMSSDGDLEINKGKLDFWIMKLSSNGTMQWQASFGGSQDETAKSIKQTIEGGYIVVGESASVDGDLENNQGNVDYWIIKLDSLGNIEWQNSLGGTNADIASDVIQVSDQGYVVAGYVGSHNTGDVAGHDNLGLFDFWVVKLNNMGELLWQKPFGGTENDWCRSITQCLDGGYITTGTTTSTDGDVLDNDGGADFWVVKLDGEGNIKWQKTLGGSEPDFGFDIKQTSDLGFVLAGYAWSSDGDVSATKGYSDFWVVKLSPETVGVEPESTFNSAPLHLAPNPASHTLYMNAAATEGHLIVSVSDLLGREIARQSLVNGEGLDVSAWPSGTYLVRAQTLSGNSFFGKFVKE